MKVGVMFANIVASTAEEIVDLVNASEEAGSSRCGPSSTCRPAR